MVTIRATALFLGRVQGVCFRAFTREQAEKNRLTGWVRNCADGSVEAVFEGDEKSVRNVLSCCKQGPPGAQVTGVDCTWMPATGEFSGFSIRFDRISSVDG